MQDFLRRNFWSVNLATIAVGSFLAAGLVTEVAAVLILKPPAVGARAAKDSLHLSIRPVKPEPGGVLLTTLGGRNLFDAEPKVVESADDANAGAANDGLDLNIDLLGTLVSAKPEWSLATIRVDGTSKLIRIGVTVSDKAEVVEITARYIVLQNGAKQQVVRLWDVKTADKAAAAKKAPASQVAVAGGPPAEDFTKGVKKTGANDYQIDRSMLEENLQDLSKLGMQARIVPNYEGGRYAGFRLVGVRPDSIYKAIGLQSGDLIRRVNGSDIDTPNKAIELFEQLRNSPSISLDIERRGQKVTQMYQIK
jgi:general secretion pathway protein C